MLTDLQRSHLQTVATIQIVARVTAREAKVELRGGWGGAAGKRGVISHITIQRGIAVKEKRPE